MRLISKLHYLNKFKISYILELLFEHWAHLFKSDSFYHKSTLFDFFGLSWNERQLFKN